MTKDEYIRELGKAMAEGRYDMNGGCFYQSMMLGFVVVAFVVCFMCSCKTPTKIEYVDREVVKYEKQYVHDTTIMEKHDSVFHTIFQKGDTVFDTKYVEKTKWRDRVVYKTDTCYRDSIQTVIKESVKEKQKIPKWCYFCLVVCVLFIIFAIVKLIRRIQWH